MSLSQTVPSCPGQHEEMEVKKACRVISELLPNHGATTSTHDFLVTMCFAARMSTCRERVLQAFQEIAERLLKLRQTGHKPVELATVSVICLCEATCECAQQDIELPVEVICESEAAAVKMSIILPPLKRNML